MADLQFDLPLGDTEEKKEDLNGFQVGYQETKLRSGVGIEDETYQKILTSYPDYNENAEDYQKFAGLWDNNRVRYTHALNNKTFRLDENNEIVDGEGHFPGASLLYDMDAMKGYMLAETNGFNPLGFDAVYSGIVEEKSKELNNSKKDTSLMGNIIGSLSAYATEPETLVDLASPGKIIGSTISKGAAKAFAVEALYATSSEVMRQEKIKEHMERAGLEYTLWDSTQEILVNAGFAGAIRGIGSAISDWSVVSKINKGITNATDSEIFERWAKREQFKLTQNTNKHLQLVDQVEADIDSGKNVDLSAHTDIDIDSKTDEAIEPNNFIEGISEDYQIKGYDIEEKALDDDVKAPLLNQDDVYGGMATNEDGDALIKEFGSHPDIEAELRELEDLESAFKSQNEATQVSSKFGDNLAAGTLAGVEQDEQGNITLDPEKFVAGLGGYTAAKAMFKSGAFDDLPQELNSQVKKMFGVDLDSSIVGDVKTLKTLATENKSTIPKVPVGSIFKNDYDRLPRNKIQEIDKIIDSGDDVNLPLENIDVNLIVPTQKNVTIPNLEKVQKLTTKPNEDIILVENDGLFYLIDGHHRVSTSILDGLDNIEARILKEN